MRVQAVAGPLIVWLALALHAPAAEGRADEQLLRSARVGTDDASLLEFLSKRTATKADPDLTRAAVRLVARRKPERAVAALLAYLPAAEDESVAEAVRDALAALAVRDGRADPDLLDALRKGPETTRSVAADALCRADGGKAARTLLRDPSPELRLAVAVALLDVADGEAVSVLIDLLAGARREAKQALDRLGRLAGPLAPFRPLGANPEEQKKCRDDWASWWRSADGESLLAYFRQRTPQIAPDRAAELVDRLGSKSFKAREQATRELVKLRGLAVSLLEKAARSDDREVARRAEDCLREIRTAPDAAKSAAHVRLLALRKPDGAAAALLAFAPFADDAEVVDEVRQALVVLARRDRDRTALAGALADRSEVRRGLAAAVLAAVGGPENRTALRKLLDDPEPAVRFRAAMGLALTGEKAAVPALVDLLDKAGEEQAREAEELLRHLAGEKAPAAGPGSDAAARGRCREAWAAWWKANGAAVDMTRARSGPAFLGYTLVSQWNPSLNTNEIVELGRDGRERWKIEGLGFAFDFEVLPGNRLLCAENNQNRVTERNFRGEILWEHKVAGPVNCQRLPNGHTFIATTSRILVVDRGGRAVLEVARYSGIMAGQRLRDGQIVVMTAGGRCIRLDADGREVGAFQLLPMNNFGGLQALPGGRFLIALWDQHKVLEYDLDGKKLWEKEVRSPNFATRLPGGHVLVGSQDTQALVEIDRGGRVVWEHKPGKGIWRARRR